MDTTHQSIQPGAEVWAKDGTALKVLGVEPDAVFAEANGQQYAIPLSAFSGIGSNRITLNTDTSGLQRWTLDGDKYQATT